MVQRKLFASASAVALSAIATVSSSGNIAVSTDKLEMIGSVFGKTCFGDDTHQVLKAFQDKAIAIGTNGNVWFTSTINDLRAQTESQSGCHALVDGIVSTISNLSADSRSTSKLGFVLDSIVGVTSFTKVELQAIHSVARSKTVQMKELIGKSGDTYIYDVLDSLSSRILSMSDSDDSDSTSTDQGGSYATDRAKSGAGADKRVAA